MSVPRSPLILVALLAVAGCYQPQSAPEPAAPSVEGGPVVPGSPPQTQAPSSSPAPEGEPEAVHSPEPRPRSFHMPDEWVGRWDGPEGLFVEITPGAATNTVRLRLKDTLDGASDYEGVLLDDGIQFERAGRVEVLRHGTGAETGYSALRSRKDCVIVRTGEEGYCRPVNRPRIHADLGTTAQPAPAAVLPLATGVFVSLDQSCGDPDHDSLRTFDGRGIGKPRARECRAVVVANRGPLYTVDNSCIDPVVGDGRMATERLEVAVGDTRHFSIRSGGVRSRYKMCERDQLPAAYRRG